VVWSCPVGREWDSRYGRLRRSGLRQPGHRRAYCRMNTAIKGQAQAPDEFLRTYERETGTFPGSAFAPSDSLGLDNTASLPYYIHIQI
jgi:hypothetical protein